MNAYIKFGIKASVISGIRYMEIIQLLEVLAINKSLSDLWSIPPILHARPATQRSLSLSPVKPWDGCILLVKQYPWSGSTYCQLIVSFSPGTLQGGSISSAWISCCLYQHILCQETLWNLHYNRSLPCCRDWRITNHAKEFIDALALISSGCYYELILIFISIPFTLYMFWTSQSHSQQRWISSSNWSCDDP